MCEHPQEQQQLHCKQCHDLESVVEAILSIKDAIERLRRDVSILLDVARMQTDDSDDDWVDTEEDNGEL